MKKRSGIRLVLLSLVLAAILLHSSAAAKEVIGAIKEEKGVSLESIDEIFTLVNNEYVKHIKQIDLINGGLEGIRAYFKKQKKDSAFVKDIPGNLPYKQAVAKFNEIYRKALTKAAPGAKEQLSYYTIKGMLKTLNDPYSVFLDPKEYASLMEQMKGGSFGGIGIYIEMDKDKGNQLTVVETIEGTPGHKAGLKSGDLILKVNGKSTKGLKIEDAQKLLRGDVGSKAVLTVQRSGVKEPFDIEVVRDTIRVRSLSSKMLDNNVGYIKLMIFGDNTSHEMKAALEDLEKKGARAYILDLRNNGGGYVNAALNVCSEFLSTGSNVVTIIKKGVPDIPYQSIPNIRTKAPLVNLVNKYSASASEITAGALQDHHAGVVMGTKTFGKASVQKIYPMPNGSAIKLTTAHYVTPNKRNINKIGISPDRLIEEKTATSEKDPQLEAAKAFLLEEMKKKELERLDRSVYKDSIHVRNLEEQYSYLRKVYGEKARIKKNVLVFEKGQFYDRVTIDSGDGEKTVIFDLHDLL
ncbi:MAG: S41 family peptidase [Candidatus Eremiobacteraeota bacterium]|nr:S41 family peptidase [Candidatus Eremiobacteraeota bacterium]